MDPTTLLPVISLRLLVSVEYGGWPLLGWGIGLGAHALGVFGFGGGGLWGRDWEERKTGEMMDKERES